MENEVVSPSRFLCGELFPPPSSGSVERKAHDDVIPISMNNLNHEVHCCADCGSVAEGGVSLKACKSCMSVKYCNVNCQRNHWKKHKKECKQRAAEIYDEALFKDPPPKEECPICFLPMPERLLSCMTLPPATISSVPIADFAEANEELADMSMETYASCCGKSICGGCIHSFGKTRNNGT